MLTKLRDELSAHLPLSNESETLLGLGYENATLLKRLPGKSVLRLQKSSNVFYVKVEPESTNNSSNVLLEYRLHCLFHPNLLIQTFASQGMNFLVTPELKQIKSTTIDEVRRCLSQYRYLSGQISHILPSSRKVEFLLNKFSSSIDIIEDQGLLDVFWRRRLSLAFQEIQAHVESTSPAICHGDASNTNFYAFGEHLLLLDWEDCFWGFAGFDEVYFLSFLANRDKLTKKNLQKSGLDLELAISIYLMVVVLKERINSKTPELRRQFTLEDRLNFVRF